MATRRDAAEVHVARMRGLFRAAIAVTAAVLMVGGGASLLAFSHAQATQVSASQLAVSASHADALARSTAADLATAKATWLAAGKQLIDDAFNGAGTTAADGAQERSADTLRAQAQVAADKAAQAAPAARSASQAAAYEATIAAGTATLTAALSGCVLAVALLLTFALFISASKASALLALHRPVPLHDAAQATY